MIRVLTVEELRRVRQASAEWASKNLSPEEARKIMIENGCSELTTKENQKTMNEWEKTDEPSLIEDFDEMLYTLGMCDGVENVMYRAREDERMDVKFSFCKQNIQFVAALDDESGWGVDLGDYNIHVIDDCYSAMLWIAYELAQKLEKNEIHK